MTGSDRVSAGGPSPGIHCGVEDAGAGAGGSLGPAGPWGPWGPVWPRRLVRVLVAMSLRWMARARILLLVMALLRSWRSPTLLRGSSLVAA
jgi:hypothetical protein